MLGGTFDAEEVSKAWAEDIKLPLGSQPPTADQGQKEDEEAEHEPQSHVTDQSAIARYEEWCRDPNSGGMAVVESAMHGGDVVGVESENTQEFFERQLKLLEAFKSKVPERGADNTVSTASRRSDFPDEQSISEHIGPVQFNMGGIQVDADDMLQRLKVGGITYRQVMSS